MVFILPPFVHKADEYASKDNMQGVALVHYLAGFFGVNLIIGLCVGIGYYMGSPAIEAFLSIIPEWISKGLEITMGLLPAIGFGLLMKMIMNKSNICFFILGFGLSVYLNLPGTGIAVFGAIIAIVLTQIKRSQQLQPAMNVEGGIDDDDDF